MKCIIHGYGGPQADPYIFKYKETYYVLITGVDGIRLLKGRTPYEYDCLGIIISHPEFNEFWAPSIIEKDGTFYIYFSMLRKEEKDQHQEKIYVAKSNDIEGPYEIIGPLLEPFSIDPHVVEYNGDLYIFYSSNDYTSPRSGTYILVDKLLSPTQTEGKPKPMLLPTLKEEIFQKDRFEKGKDWYTLEGAFYFQKDNTHYLMYSGNCYLNDNYFIGYATSNEVVSDLRDLRFKKHPDENTYQPLLSKNSFETSTGHNSILIESGDYYVFYHGRDIVDGRNDTDTRSMRVARLDFDKDQLIINQEKGM